MYQTNKPVYSLYLYVILFFSGEKRALLLKKATEEQEKHFKAISK